MRFRPVWAYIDGIREFCRFFCATTFSGDVAERASVVVQETLENAVKYSTDGENGRAELLGEAAFVAQEGGPAQGFYAVVVLVLIDSGFAVWVNRFVAANTAGSP